MEIYNTNLEKVKQERGGNEASKSENVDISLAAKKEEVTINQVKQPIDKQLAFAAFNKQLINLGDEVADYMNFAYMLFKKKYCFLFEEKDQNGNDVLFNYLRVNFCDMAKYKSVIPDNNISRLEMAYVCDMFSRTTYTKFFFDNDAINNIIKMPCQSCCMSLTSKHKACPYHILAFMEYIYKTPDKIEQEFDNILGNKKMKFKYNQEIPAITTDDDDNTNLFNIIKQTSNTLTDEVVTKLVDTLVNLDAKSVYGAMLMLQMQVIKMENQTDYSYRYLNLCNYELKGEVISSYINFWNGQSGSFVTHTDISSLIDAVNKKLDCPRCGYANCPHTIAALFLVLERFTQINAIDFAYSIYIRNRYPGISPQDVCQLDRFKLSNEKSALTDASKAEFNQMIMYVVARKANGLTPFLNLGLHIYSSDSELSEQFINAFADILWCYDYFSNGRRNNFSVERIYLSSTPVNTLVKHIRALESGKLVVLYHPEQIEQISEFDAGYYDLLRTLEARKKDIIIVIVGEKFGIESFFSAHSELKKKHAPRCIEIEEMKRKNVSEGLFDKLETSMIVEDEAAELLKKYVNAVYSSSNLKSYDFINDLYERIIFNHFSNLAQMKNAKIPVPDRLRVEDIPSFTPPRTEEEIFLELNKLIGLENVKTKLKEISSLVKFDMKLSAKTSAGVKHNFSRMNMHMVFGGNAGTGKTTVARLTAEILYSIGFIQENKLVCCSAKDLIGEYVGQTTPKTAKKCEEAYNGVLFIDEAYQLNPHNDGPGGSYKEECVVELIQQMENNRDRLVIIFAGYTDEMNDFIENANSGLSSRIGTFIDFPDYSTEQLISIFYSIASGEGIAVEEGAEKKLEQIFELARQDKSKFGNARFARNVYERSKLTHATNSVHYADDDPRLMIIGTNEITD